MMASTLFGYHFNQVNCTDEKILESLVILIDKEMIARKKNKIYISIIIRVFI